MMISYRRESLPEPLNALAWREAPDPETGRARLTVVVSEQLSAKDARDEALKAVRALPRRRGRRSGAIVAALAAITAASLGAKVAMPLPDTPPPRGRRVYVVAELKTPLPGYPAKYIASAPAGARAA